ncbi:MAG: hypothetical protein KJO95_09565, partial [Gammaproteobacteria bacterium]|nr:hypothetical protein [Gammaproteobacteria bacterium]
MNKSLVAICFVALLCSCGQSEPAFDKAAYEAEVLEWREGRLARLKAPTGYLNQIGLFWLEEGDYRFGSGADNDIRLPAKAASSIGVFEVNEAGVRMTAEAGVDVFSDDEPVTSILILDDTTEAPVQVTHRSFAWTVVQRDGRFAVRV